MNNFLEFIRQPLFGEFNAGMSMFASIMGTAIFFVYLIAVALKYGILKSISISFYKVRWLFQAFMYSSMFCILGIEQNMWYLAVALCGTIMAMFPSVLLKNFIYPHCVFAFLLIALGLVGLPVCHGVGAIGYCVDAIILIIATLLIERKNPWLSERKVYFVEVEALSCMLIGLVIENIQYV